MRKRKNSAADEEEGSEMEIDGEEKIGDQERKEGEEDEDEDDEQLEMEGEDEDEQPIAVEPAIIESPFLDSFYDLSAADPKERSKAAQTMLQHCLLGPNANSKDAAYAFRRLLNGVCSGRAAARQGNASALASFLKIAFHLGKMDEIRSEAANSSQPVKDNGGSDLMYVRDRLLAATDPHQTTGKKKGSEERDYQFGRLFGILGVVRSNILIPSSEGEYYDVREVATALISDLVDLFWLKKWMREPAAHGITTMLKLFLEADEESKTIGQDLVEQVIVPKVLAVTQDQTGGDSDRKKLLQNYCAEQVGIAVFIQSRPKSTGLPFPLDESIVSTETIPWIGQALSETSVVVQPRVHFVWDALWCFLTEPGEDMSLSHKSTINVRRLRDKIPLSGDSALNVIDSVMRIVIKEKLLRMDKDSSTAKATHERRSLALCTVKNLSGVPFVSSLSGPTQIIMDGDAMESVLLTPDVVKTLFLNVICAGNQSQQTSHILKPLALEVLGSLTNATLETGGARQLSCVKAFLNSTVKFDVRTKTSTVTDLLSFSSDTTPTEKEFDLWNEYLAHLESRFLELCGSMEDPDTCAQASGYVELLYSAAKHILRVGTESEEDIENKLAEYKEQVVKRILGFFMGAAFFDCSGLTMSPHSKKKKGNKANKKISSNSIIEAAFKIKESVGDGNEVPYSVRVIASARFFSLVSDFTMVVSRESKGDDHAKVEKDSNTLAVLSDLCDCWKQLESNGAKRFAVESEKNKDEEDDSDPEGTINYLKKRVEQLSKSGDALKQSQKRCGTGVAVLAMTLYLHRLSCGPDNSVEEDPDADEEDDEEEICGALEGLKAVADDFLDGNESDSNPLLGLAELCANILSSPVGSGSIGRGASPRLVREAVKYAWLGGLRLASSMATKEKTLLDSSVIDILMESIGATTSDDGDETDGDDDMDNEDIEESGSDEDNEADDHLDEDLIFSKASKLLEDPDDMEIEEKNDAPEDGDESDVEIDSSKLQTMLEEDSDADVDENVLEHHEGADAALAKLIKLKQDARKAGQQVRERIEVSNQVRCTFLIELLLGRPDAWNQLFRSNILEMVLPLLKHRKRVAASTYKAIESGAKIGTGEKKALLDRLTNLLKQKLCKLRLPAMPMMDPVNLDSATDLLKQLIKEAKQAKDKEQVSCCGTCLVFVLRAMPSSPDVVDIVSEEYGQLIREWSTKRGSGAALLDDLIAHIPGVAQAALVTSLGEATQNARSPFLKVEAFRLLSLLLAAKPNSDPSDIDKLAKERIHGSQQDLVNIMVKTLADEEMCNPKRVRTVLKALEKVLTCMSTPVTQETLSSLDRVKSQVQKLGEKKLQGKGGVTSVSTKLVGLIDEKVAELRSTSRGKDSGTANPNSPQNVSANDEEKAQNATSDSNKKSKKKNKKKKKR